MVHQGSQPFKGMNIKVVSETIPTHEYEAKTLAKAFEEITGIKVSFDLIQEGDVIEKLQTQWASGQNIYDAWINDSDLIGTHARYGYVVPLSDFMAGEGKDVTLPTLDVDDLWARNSPPGRTESSTSCRTSSSPTFTGSATTGSNDRRFQKAVQGDLRL
jgi:glycerol transport system substrate-binding protein